MAQADRPFGCRLSRRALLGRIEAPTTSDNQRMDHTELGRHRLTLGRQREVVIAALRA